MARRAHTQAGHKDRVQTLTCVMAHTQASHVGVGHAASSCSVPELHV